MDIRHVKDLCLRNHNTKTEVTLSLCFAHTVQILYMRNFYKNLINI